MYFCGEPLKTVMSVSQHYIAKFRSWKQTERELCLAPLQQLMENLTDPTKKDYFTFTGQAMEEESWMEKTEIVNDAFRTHTFWLLKTFIAVYLNDHQKAREFVAKLMKCDLANCNCVSFFQTYFLDSLVDVLLARDKSNGGGKAKRYKTSLKKLRFYGKDAPANVKNKISLIEAEVDVLKHGKKSSSTAMSKFHDSIEEAKQEGLLFEEAYACERCAIAMLEWGDMTRSLEYFERARNLYQQWGSPVKVSQLMKYVEENCGVKMQKQG